MIKDENYRNQPVNPADKYTAAVVLAIALMLCAGLLGGCAPTTTEVEKGESGQEPMVFNDRVTGCDYLTTQDRVVLTPRIAADGKTHMGCKAVK